MKRLIKRCVVIVMALIMSFSFHTGTGLAGAVEVKADDGNLSFYEKFIVSSPDGKQEITKSTAIMEANKAYCYVGDRVTFSVYSYEPYVSEDIYIDLNEYSLKWYRIEESETKQETELDETGLSYEIDSVDETDFFYQNDCKVYYRADIYKDGKLVEELIFSLDNKAEYVYAKGKTCCLSVGDNVTLEPELFDYEGNPINIAHGNYTFKWYKTTIEEVKESDSTTVKSMQESELETTDSGYTINNIQMTDLSHCNGYRTYYNVNYQVQVYKDGIIKSTANFYLEDKAETIKVKGNSYSVSKMDSLKLSVSLYDYDDNLLEPSDGEYTVEWTKVRRALPYENTDLAETGLSYTIDEVSHYDFDEPGAEDVYYSARVYKNGIYKGEAKFYIYDRNATSQTTGTLSADDTEKVTTPAEAKIKKVYAKKKTAKKIKLSLKKVKGADGYQVAVYKTKKNAKKNKKAIVKKFSKKAKVTVKSKKLKNQKKLFVNVRAYALDGKTKVYGKWSAVKKVRIK